MKGWSVNLTVEGQAQVLDFPVPALLAGPAGSTMPTMEVVFWSDAVNRWVHIVSAYFVRDLPAGHVQATVGDLAWIEQVVARSGIEGLRHCIADLEANMVPEA